MQRILERGRIEEAGADRPPRVRLPDPSGPFAARAARLRALAGEGEIGRSIADYLELMAAVADAQQAALAAVGPAVLSGDEENAEEGTSGLAALPATARPPGPIVRDVLDRLVSAVDAGAELPGETRAVLRRLQGLSAEALDRQIDALLARRHDEIDAAAAPFVMAALQVPFAAAAARLTPGMAEPWAGVPRSCPVCATPPVASVVREDDRSRGHRYLHCPLCATEWHLVRITCSHCRSTQGISYMSLDGGPDAIRAECCDRCRTYRKIFYQEKDELVEPVADDLASLSLDLLLAEAGYHRASGHPFLWNGHG